MYVVQNYNVKNNTTFITNLKLILNVIIMFTVMILKEKPQHTKIINYTFNILE